MSISCRWVRPQLTLSAPPKWPSSRSSSASFCCALINFCAAGVPVSQRLELAHINAVDGMDFPSRPANASGADRKNEKRSARSTPHLKATRSARDRTCNSRCISNGLYGSVDICSLMRRMACVKGTNRPPVIHRAARAVFSEVKLHRSIGFTRRDRVSNCAAVSHGWCHARIAAR
jgi:hypothetical protein